MTFQPLTQHKLFKPALGALLTVLCGLALWHFEYHSRNTWPTNLQRTRFGEALTRFSYDSLFRFATRHRTNPEIVILFMDVHSFTNTSQRHGEPWNRALHTKLLNRLAEDRCPLLVFDVWFGEETNKAIDLPLAAAMKQLSNVVLMAWPIEELFQPDTTRVGTHSIEPAKPAELFLNAVGEKNWGVGGALTNSDGVVRQHWRFPSPGLFNSLAWTAAQVSGAQLGDEPQERWMRYYEPGWAWTSLGYVNAEAQPANYFRGKIVFIGNKPKDDLPNGEEDEFSTPFTRKRSGAVGGVEILATEFLNLVNGEWLRRPPDWVEVATIVIVGAVLGYGLRSRGRILAGGLALAAAFLALVAGVCLAYFTNYWFPWLIIAGGQVPVALVFALVWPARSRRGTIVIPLSVPDKADVPLPRIGESPEVPDYELVEPPFGKGAYGKVWLARNAVGQWQAIKAIYRAKFGEDASPYEREFRGIESYKRVSDKHPGLLRIDFVSRMKPEGYFYYAMELGDALTPGWEQNPAIYSPLDLAALCARSNGRLPPGDCVRIGAKLCEPLQFLHAQGLTHRDIKPRNIIFVNGHPKLADVGLVADAQRPASEITWVGTPGFMPPEPEQPGTPQADIYGLGMMLYVISTGSKPTVFPELSSTLVDRNRYPEFNLLCPVIFKACDPDCGKRFATVVDMQAALREVETALTRRATQTKPAAPQNPVG